MHLLFPADPFDTRQVDEFFQPQADAAKRFGFNYSTVVFNMMGDAIIKGGIPDRERCVYRGWMLTEDAYLRLSDRMDLMGNRMLVSPYHYLSAHLMTSWYHKLAPLGITAETVFTHNPVNVSYVENMLAAYQQHFGWTSFFVKDFVKSLKSGTVSPVVTHPSQIGTLMEEMINFRGFIEGGLSIRKHEDYVPNSEIRYFVLLGRNRWIWGPTLQHEIPDVVRAVAGLIPSPFFSVDVAQRTDGVLRVVEIGDGQVSDLVGETPNHWVPDTLAHVMALAFHPKENCL